MSKKDINFGVLVFPGSNCDRDCQKALEKDMGVKAHFIWHKDHCLENLDAVVVPGGFSYGDYLRAGAIARYSPVMKDVVEFARKGKPVIGICNGFQILTEVGLLPGALARNKDLHFICKDVHLKVATNKSPFTRALQGDEVLRIPVAHGEGNYFADEATLDSLFENDQVLFQYSDLEGNLTDIANPNGSCRSIAGICNKERNVLGMMPHPERVSHSRLGGTDGQWIFKSLIEHLEESLS